MPEQRQSARANNGGLGKKLFTFVVYGDSHLNQSETESMSPHEVNKLANGRHRYVIDQINHIAPAFAIHLGDLVHPVPVMAIYADAAARFHEQVADLACPLHVIPGNHDIGDKPIRWGPAEPVSEHALALWEQHFGSSFHAFEHEGCRMILLNAEIINSGLAAEAEQRQWFEAELETHRTKRLFVAIHYPPFIYRTDELEYYDNIAEPGRSWLVNLVAEYGVEAVFSGHVHNFWYHTIGETAFYILPSITFVRHDYSEMARVPPGPEAGRNDAVKLGFFTVDVHERGHVCKPVRSCGRMMAAGMPAEGTNRRLPPPHPRLNERDNFGFDLRQPWAEIVEIPPSGGLDEFARKTVRNDYPLLALWEMGVRRLRIPFQDLLDARLRERMRELKALGMEFSIFSYKLPDALPEALVAHSDLVSAWELAVPPEEIDEMLALLQPLKAESGVAIYLSRLRSKDDMETDGQRYYHVINHGYVPGERDTIAELAARNAFREVVDGVVFRIPREREAWDEILAIGALARDVGIEASVHARIATSNPAAEAREDLANANRIAETLAASLTQPHVSVYLDTFADVDRGYFVRNGVVDRRFNPRLGLNVVRNLYACFGQESEAIAPAGRCLSDACSVAGLRQDGQLHALVTPAGNLSEFPLPDDSETQARPRSARLIDLATGAISESRVAAGSHGGMRLESTELPANPFIVSFARKTGG